MYQRGKQLDRYFGDSRLTTLDTNKINVSNLEVDGKTALGPALALALGIISEHDNGSRIITVTDSAPNYGILS